MKSIWKWKRVTKSYSRDSIFRPGMAKYIDLIIQTCNVCQWLRILNAKEAWSVPITTKPWEKGIKSMFARHRIPSLAVRNHNKPQMTSLVFTQFSKEWGGSHVTTSLTGKRSDREIRTRLLAKTKTDGKDTWVSIQKYQDSQCWFTVQLQMNGQAITKDHNYIAQDHRTCSGQPRFSKQTEAVPWQGSKQLTQLLQNAENVRIKVWGGGLGVAPVWLTVQRKLQHYTQIL